jgi:hypothetical protein
VTCFFPAEYNAIKREKLRELEAQVDAREEVRRRTTAALKLIQGQEKDLKLLTDEETKALYAEQRIIVSKSLHPPPLPSSPPFPGTSGCLLPDSVKACLFYFKITSAEA